MVPLTQDEEAQCVVVLRLISRIRILDAERGSDDETEAGVEETKGGQDGVRVGVAEDELPVGRDELLGPLVRLHHGSVGELSRTMPIPATPKKSPMKAFVTLTPRKPIRAKDNVVSVVEKAPIARAVYMAVH